MSYIQLYVFIGIPIILFDALKDYFGKIVFKYYFDQRTFSNNTFYLFNCIPITTNEVLKFIRGN